MVWARSVECMSWRPTMRQTPSRTAPTLSRTMSPSPPSRWILGSSVSPRTSPISALTLARSLWRLSFTSQMVNIERIKRLYCIDNWSIAEKGGDPGEKLANATFTATLVQFNAFRPLTIPDSVFQTASDCNYRPNDIVPIIVGCALAGMVVMVLIAYMVGRSRWVLILIGRLIRIRVSDWLRHWILDTYWLTDWITCFLLFKILGPEQEAIWVSRLDNGFIMTDKYNKALSILDFLNITSQDSTTWTIEQSKVIEHSNIYWK